LFPAIGVPGWASILLGVMALNFAIYLQHVLFHAVPALWRLHRMHHADLAFDVSTGTRFHPIEVLSRAVGARMWSRTGKRYRGHWCKLGRALTK
jgi:sterol desaturase/sphingolipid hydroxylase (fatty acid hydroxylase superfamily)